MLDGAEALFRSGGNLSNIRKQPVGIGAIDTADFLDCVQIGQTASVEDQVVLASNLGNSIDGKANGLVDGNEEVQQQKRNRTSVD